MYHMFVFFLLDIVGQIATYELWPPLGRRFCTSDSKGQMSGCHWLVGSHAELQSGYS